MNSQPSRTVSSEEIEQLVRARFPGDWVLLIADTPHGVRVNADTRFHSGAHDLLLEHGYTVTVHGSSLWVTGRNDR